MKKMLLIGLSAGFLVGCNSGTNQPSSSNSLASAQKSSVLNHNNPPLCSSSLIPSDFNINQTQVDKNIEVPNLSEPASVYLYVLSNQHGSGYCDTGYNIAKYLVNTQGLYSNPSNDQYLGLGGVAQSSFLTQPSTNSSYKSLHVLVHQMYNYFSSPVDLYVIHNFRIESNIVEDNSNPTEVLSELPGKTGYTAEYITYRDVDQNRFVYVTGYANSEHTMAWVGAYIENTVNSKKVLDAIVFESYSLVSRDQETGDMVVAKLQPLTFPKNVGENDYAYFTAAYNWGSEPTIGIYQIPFLSKGVPDFTKRIVTIPNLYLNSGVLFFFQLNSGESFVYVKNGQTDIQVSQSSTELDFNEAVHQWSLNVGTMALDPFVYSNEQHMYIVGADSSGSQAANVTVSEFGINKTSGALSPIISLNPQMNNVSNILFAQLQNSKGKCNTYNIFLGTKYLTSTQQDQGVIKLFGSNSPGPIISIAESKPKLPQILGGYIDSAKPCNAP